MKQYTAEEIASMSLQDLIQVAPQIGLKIETEITVRDADGNIKHHEVI